MTRHPILCVDDDPSNLAVLRQVLRDSYPLVFARSGAEALAAVAKHLPSLILLDVEMPGMDGYEVCRRLTLDRPTGTIPVIFVTSRGNESDETAGFAAGGVDYITKPISAPVVRARVRTHLSLVRAEALESSYRATVHMLGKAGHYNDTDTGAHIWRMAAYSRALAEASGWDEERCNLLEMAAAMHDTGKIGIPDSILKKPGRFDAKEAEIMKTHALIGHEILSKGEGPLFRLAAEIALYHHERWDGSGYPLGIAGENIPESARIVAVGDVFDALSTKRPYKEAWPLERVLATIESSAGTHFDPIMIDRFREILPRILDIKSGWDAREVSDERDALPPALPARGLSCEVASRAGVEGTDTAAMAEQVKMRAVQVRQATELVGTRISKMQVAIGEAVEAIGQVARIIGEIDTAPATAGAPRRTSPVCTAAQAIERPAPVARG